MYNFPLEKQREREKEREREREREKRERERERERGRERESIDTIVTLRCTYFQVTSPRGLPLSTHCLFYVFDLGRITGQQFKVMLMLDQYIRQ